ncbi:RyR domain-containing protein [Clostridium sp. AM58-1XD]|uniref:RyR domain-containing protein n=1 Tax=Clostridium sp. AM58-1XD TaxID=2292307 RepID=UPI000E468A99|nr:RyR domain-containing protein [Clostridium sp. AM58-1XD]RGY95765.1 Ryanodine receptor Ryr [Clostridium sp. AM58-1XD]
MKYIPRPLDTSTVLLDEELQNSLETVSQNIHEVWSQKRIETGWRYGAVYDGDKKLHPCLAPYDSLSEEEKDLDRATVIQTVKTLLKMGYQIKKEDLK